MGIEPAGPRAALDEAAIRDAKARAPISSLWRHARTRRLYMVLGYCWLEATARPAVLYTEAGPLTQPIWARDAAEFFEKFADAARRPAE